MCVLPARSPLRSSVCGVCLVLLVSRRHTHACRSIFLQTDTFLFPDRSIYRASYCKHIQADVVHNTHTHTRLNHSVKEICTPSANMIYRQINKSMNGWKQLLLLISARVWLHILRFEAERSHSLSPDYSTERRDWTCSARISDPLR